MTISHMFAVDPTANSKQGQLLSNSTVCVQNFRTFLILYRFLFFFPDFHLLLVQIHHNNASVRPPRRYDFAGVQHTPRGGYCVAEAHSDKDNDICPPPGR